MTVVCIFAVLLALFIGLAVGAKKRQQAVDFEADYYFLIEKCEDSTAAAVAGRVHSSGGAGYLFRGGKAVIVACYYTVQDAERVRDAMLERGADVEIAPLSAQKFYLSGENAAYAAHVAANAETAESCARLLYDVANGLERAQMGQTEARDAVRGAAGSLAGLRKSNGGAFYDRWNAELASAERECREISDGIAFAKEVRRVQAQLLCALVGLEEYF